MSNFVVALLVGGAVFFAVQALLTVMLRRQAPRSAQVQAMLAEEERRAARPTPQEWFRAWAASRGYQGALVPLLGVLVALYLAATLVLQAVLHSQVAALVLAAPFASAVVFLVGAQLAARRKRQFDRQLLDALVMLGGQLEAGVGIMRALQQVRASAADPLRAELGVVLRTADVTHNLIEPMGELAERYPSRAFELFIAALRIDAEVGGRIEPALKEAADIMQRDFALIEEARAEMSQAKSEFFGILIMMGFIFASVIGSSSPEARTLYFSPGGIVVLSFIGGWVGLGVLRALNVMRRANGLPPVRVLRRKADAEEVRA